MQCPVCGEDCVQTTHEIVDLLPGIFSPCENCKGRILDKRLPLPDAFYAKPCACGKRFIDEIFAHLYVIMVEEKEMNPSDPLYAVGTPLVHPGFSMSSPPYLPEKSLLLLTSHATRKTAGRLMKEVPEIRGVVKSGNFVPGLVGESFTADPPVYELLAGCDVRADIFYTSTGPLALYKQQSLIHIEFPRGYEPKILAVEKRINEFLPAVFVDACCGIGTLGLTAAQMGIRQVIMNDAWYAAAFWAAHNLNVNKEYFQIDNVHIHRTYDEMKKKPVLKTPLCIAEATGEQTIRVYQGDFHELYKEIPRTSVLTAIDLFEKDDPVVVKKMVQEWQERIGGQVFIP